ncbi:MAG: hypothetical protein H6710_15450 [Myxococcales bacterium]|nr:hypothetical protein [Myxococcales bacterium]MCB9701967.1 hypothetical protein [Myxococcales bacterium]
MHLINARHHRPRWSLPPSLIEHIERSLRSARSHLDAASLAELEHRARLVRAGAAAPDELLARIQVLLAG